MSTTVPPPSPHTEIPPPSDWTEAVKVDKHQNPWTVMIDYIKTIITLASGILGVTVTFVNALV